MMTSDNYALIVSRTVYTATEKPWRDIQVTNSLAEFGIMATRPGNTAPIFPLYFSSISGSRDMFAEEGRKENLQPAFRAWLAKKYRKKYEPEEILGYIYAMLHSPSFREQYRELLKMDFPRVPFVDDARQFEALAAQGWELVKAHLMKKIPAGVIASFPVSGNNRANDVRYEAATKRLYINKEQYFENVPPEAWDFAIGGYQVLDKYLKERRKADRPLTAPDLQHIPKVARILAYTTEKMKEIDKIFSLGVFAT
jgi:predicted helicase